jgi:SAM-dependent methyltransferase
MWDTTHKVGEWLVHAIDPEPGDKVLELAAGLGDTGFTLSRMLGDQGHLILSDFSEKMIEAARQRAGELGVRNVEFRVLDAENMDLPDESVDGVICRWGYMLMANPAAAFAETRRVLKQGRKLGFSVWAGAEQNPFISVAGRLLVEMGHMTPPESGGPGIFSMADKHRINELVKGAGFRKVEIHEMELTWRFEDFEDYWDFATGTAGPLALTINALSDEDRGAVRGALMERLEEYRHDDGYALAGTPLNVAAR